MKKFKKHNMKEREKPKIRSLEEAPKKKPEPVSVGSKFQKKEVKPKVITKIVKEECNCEDKFKKLRTVLQVIRDLADHITENTTRNEKKAYIVRETCNTIREHIDEMEF